MSQFIETIRILDGKIDLIDLHNERFNATRKLFFCVEEWQDLKQSIQIPELFGKGVVKCRIVYDYEIREIQFSFYHDKNTSTLKPIEANVSYAHKWIDRNQLNELKMRAWPADEVLILKNGMVSDTSFSNLIFSKNGQWFTSNTPLLAGLRRDQLLNDGVVEECEISYADLKNYDHFMLINAMLSFDQKKAIPIRNIQTL